MKIKIAAIYVIVQILSYGIDMGIFLAFIELFSISSLSANVAGKLFSAIFSFFAHRYVTFPQAKERYIFQQAFFYIISLFINTVFSSMMLLFLTKTISSLFFAKLLADIVAAAGGFLLSKWVVFRSAEPRREN